MESRFARVLAVVCLMPVGALAQSSADRLRAAAYMAKDLQFPAEPSKLSFFSTPRMAIYKPDGAGPFPALVIQHQCGGLGGGSNWNNAAILDWAKEAVKRGYVAFIIDSLGPRNVDTVCYGAKGNVNPIRGVKDAYQAASHLRKFPFVDQKRIAMAGYSWGARTAVMAASKSYRDALSDDDGPAAFVSFYPPCATLRPQAGSPYEAVNRDIDRPLLALMAEKDTETPPAECLPRLEAAKAAGAPVEWHVYPGLTHCWDCENLNGSRKVDYRGNQVVYWYDKAGTRDSAERMFQFLARVMPAR